MATVPQGAVLDAPVVAQRQPSLTWHINKETGRIDGEAENLAAVRQACEIILNCQRFRWQIYEAYSGVQWEGLIGEEAGYVASQLLRRVTEALMVDDRITGVGDFVPVLSGDVLTASLTVQTVYGSFETAVEAKLT